MRKTGWCSECASRQVVGKYLEREAEAIEKRRRSWVRRTSPGKLSESPDALRERQRKHRLYVAVQPHERPNALCDPWQIAFEGLRRLKMVSHAIKTSEGRKHLEAVRECIKQLAVGPAGD